MTAFFLFLTLIGMHLIGSATLGLVTTGCLGVLAAPILAIFAWPLVLPESGGLLLMYVAWRMDFPGSVRRAWCRVVLWSVLGGLVSWGLVPLEDGHEWEWRLAGFLSGAAAAAFAALATRRIAVLKEPRHQPPLPAPTSTPAPDAGSAGP